MRRPARIALVATALVVVGPLVVVALPAPPVEPGPVTYTAVLDVGAFESMTVAVHSVTLVECDDQQRSGFDGLRAVFGTAVEMVLDVSAAPAVAGHGAAEDPGAIEGQWRIEGDGDAVELGSAMLLDAAYCSAHVAFADRVPGATVNTGPTVVAETAGGESSSDVSWGVLLDLADPSGEPTVVRSGDPVVIDLHLSVGDEPVALSEAEDAGRTLLRAVAAHSTAVARP